MWKKRVCAAVAAVGLMISLTAQAELMWAQEFPVLPEEMTDAYRAQENPRLFELAETGITALGMSAEDVYTDAESIWAQSGTEESGEREVLRCDSSSLHYSKDTREKTAVGTQSEALTQAKEFVQALLGTDAFTQGEARLVEYTGDGKIATNVLDFVWDKRTAEGIAVHDMNLTVTICDGHVNAVHLWDALLEPVEMETVYACPSAQQALTHLNYAISNIDPAHTCTSFDDPADTLAQIYPVYTRIFSSDGLYTTAWALVLKDAQHGALKTPVLVDMISGDVWDYHDGRLKGAEQ